jgi:uncharacterized membrane protein YebE (DUF533 family)
MAVIETALVASGMLLALLGEAIGPWLLTAALVLAFFLVAGLVALQDLNNSASYHAKKTAKAAVAQNASDPAPDYQATPPALT